MTLSYSVQTNKIMLRQIIAILFCIALMPGLALGLSSQSLTPPRDAEIREAITSYILQKTANLGWETRIKKISISGNPVLPDGPLELEVVAPQQWEGWGSVSLAVVARQGERVVRNIP